MYRAFIKTILKLCIGSYHCLMGICGQIYTKLSHPEPAKSR